MDIKGGNINVDIVRLRALAIVFIVLHHSIAVYYSWPDPRIYFGINGALKALCFLVKDFGLALFTFISGFLITKSRKSTGYFAFLKKKAERVLIPALFWGCAYYVAFPDYMMSFSPVGVNGSHLWYLPMLFLCMVCIGLLVYEVRGRYVLLCVLILCFVLLRNTNRTFAEFISYFPVFVFGYWIGYRSEDGAFSPRSMAIAVVALLAACGIRQLFPLDIHPAANTCIVMLVNAVYYMSMTYCFYYLVRLVKSEVAGVTDAISRDSFTIYILHQFVINTVCLYCFEFIVPSAWPFWVTAIFAVSLTLPMLVKRYWRVIGG